MNRRVKWKFLILFHRTQQRMAGKFLFHLLTVAGGNLLLDIVGDGELGQRRDGACPRIGEKPADKGFGSGFTQRGVCGFLAQVIEPLELIFDWFNSAKLAERIAA